MTATRNFQGDLVRTCRRKYILNEMITEAHDTSNDGNTYSREHRKIDRTTERFSPSGCSSQMHKKPSRTYSVNQPTLRISRLLSWCHLYVFLSQVIMNSLKYVE